MIKINVLKYYSRRLERRLCPLCLLGSPWVCLCQLCIEVTKAKLSMSLSMSLPLFSPLSLSVPSLPFFSLPLSTMHRGNKGQIVCVLVFGLSAWCLCVYDCQLCIKVNCGLSLSVFLRFCSLDEFSFLKYASRSARPSPKKTKVNFIFDSYIAYKTSHASLPSR